jgi:hypothetical protein
VPEVVRQGDGLDQILVQAQAVCHRATELGHLQGMGQAGPEQIAFVVEEDLGLVNQPAKRRAVDDPIPVALKRSSRRRWRLVDAPASAGAGMARPRRQACISIAGHEATHARHLNRAPGRSQDG